MKKIFLVYIFSFLALLKIWSCAGDYYDDYSYYSLLFSQELINDPRYYPFLLAPDIPFYEADSVKVKNANIEEWQKYLGVNYEQAYYLVFKASIDDIQKLLSKEEVVDNQLKYIDKQFVKKYAHALEYIVLAKELEPFMRISIEEGYGWYYYDEKEKDIEGIPYDITSLKIQKAWKKAKDKEIKLRYGYQLVRLAHYKRNYEEAIRFFDAFVEPLKYKPEMYYYALSQKAGAIRGTGDVITANSLFFEVFSYSTDLKKTAFSSIKINENINFELFSSQANTIDEKNDADLMLGFISFSNPLSSAKKIVERSPDAIQAKVLIARAISSFEGDIMRYGDISEFADKRFPIIRKGGRKNLKEVLDFVNKQAISDEVKQKNYWNIAAAYLGYLNKDFTLAQNFLDKVDISEEGYQEQRDILAMLVDIGKTPVINDESERYIFSQYKEVFINSYSDKGRSKISSFVMDVLSNRYYLQKEYAKSFMLENDLAVLQDNPNFTLLTEIEDLYNKPAKNPFEKYLVEKFQVGSYGCADKIETTVPDYINYMKGIVYLTADELDKAKEMFDKSRYSSESVSADIFGYNQIECYTCDDNMKTDYVSEFSYIEYPMNEREIVDILIKLRSDAQGSGLKAAKANYLLGNFYYNTSLTGYFRNYLRFGYMGGYRQEFFCASDKNDILENKIYLKSISVYYDNPVDIADKYLTKAYTLASGDELKARIVFALSKCELEMHYQQIVDKYCSKNRWESYNEDWVLISDRQYFKELMKYKNTRFFKDVKTNCKYFDYYVNHL